MLILAQEEADRQKQLAANEENTVWLGYWTSIFILIPVHVINFQPRPSLITVCEP